MFSLHPPIHIRDGNAASARRGKIRCFAADCTGVAIRSCMTSHSVAVFADHLRDRVLRVCCLFTFQRASKRSRVACLLHPPSRPARRRDHYRARGDKTIATRGPRPWRGASSVPRVPGDTFARGREINNYRDAREC